VHTAAAQFDEDEHVQALQPNRLDGEEIDGEHASPVRSQELAPGHPTARADRSETRGSKPCAHRRRRDHHAKALQFANDALITPPRVVSREPDNQRSDLTADRRAPGATRVRPPLRHQAPMPAKQRSRCDDEGPPACARQEPAGGREEKPVGPRHRRTAGSSPEDGEFVPKHDDFQFLEIVRSKAQGSKLQNPPKRHVTEREEHEASSVARQPPYSTLQLFDSIRSGPFGSRTKPGFLHPSRSHLPDNVRLWQGDSVGHWEGDTLVVETTNLNGKTWLSEVGEVLSHAETVVERFIPVNGDLITYRATVTDPLVYTRPWTIEIPLQRQDEELIETACHEDNGDLQHLKDVKDAYRAAKKGETVR
jgi:hypothetical protein